MTASAQIPGCRFDICLSFLSSTLSKMSHFIVKSGELQLKLWVCTANVERDSWRGKERRTEPERALSRRGDGNTAPFPGQTTRLWFSTTYKACVCRVLQTRGCFLRVCCLISRRAEILSAGFLYCGPRMEMGSPGWDQGCAPTVIEHQCNGEGRCQRSSSAWSCLMSTPQSLHELQILGTSSTAQHILPIYTLLALPFVSGFAAA